MKLAKYFCSKVGRGHVEWRRFVRREKRRHKRQKFAAERNSALAQAAADPVYQDRLRKEQAEASRLEEIRQQQHLQLKAEWQARDLALHSLFLHNKTVKEEQLLKEIEQNAKMKQEWQNHQAKIKESFAAHAQELITSKPEPPVAAAVVTVPCPFFMKTGACRFGARCSRQHVYPTVSRTLLLQNLYSSPGYLPGADPDDSLEHDEAELQRHFREFYEDMYSEADKHGGLLELRVCCNTAQHLRGNVYLRYGEKRDAVAAAATLHGRYYAGRIVTCLFVDVDCLQQAMCGLYPRKLCHKGGECNFLHTYPNPDARYIGERYHGSRSIDRIRSTERSAKSSRSSVSEYQSRRRRARSASPRSRRTSSEKLNTSERSRASIRRSKKS